MMFGRAFSARRHRRILIYHHPSRISYAQIYPFLHYRHELLSRYGAEIRCRPFEDLLSGSDRAVQDVDTVLIQPWFTLAPDRLTRAISCISARHPTADLGFIDSYAHNDLRLARYLPQRTKFYLKKSIFRDRTLYQHNYRGDTQMMQYYADLYGIEAPAPDFQTPDWVLDRLKLSPNFLTAPHFVEAFAGSEPLDISDRPIDLHVRMARPGGSIYGTMRNAACAAVEAIPDIVKTPFRNAPYADYMAEMARSRLCFSPFGYGEVCWRDIEAIQSGAVLVKPDMSHLETLPDLYEPGETYLPVAWDFSDLDEVVRAALDNPERCGRIAVNAWDRANSYLKERRFVDDIAFLFSSEEKPPVGL